MGSFGVAALVPFQWSAAGLGLGPPPSLPLALGLAVAWLGFMYAYSPLADRLATRWFPKPPTLGAFRGLQESRAKLVLGIVVGWVLGGFLEELLFRGIVLGWTESALAGRVPWPVAKALAVCLAAAGAGLCHAYQGRRAMVIVTQLSVLFGVLFLLSGNNLWPVVLCHGLYDTIAFLRFAAVRPAARC